ncbi:MAG: cyclic nucleotide-binding domain-containing protein, partial [Marinobacter sp.]|nr:cyclic nucleotide-binding domain-containing protein [Marinobacter sp.]
MDVFTDFTRPRHARTCAFCPIKSCCQLNDPDSDFLPGSGWPVRHEATIVPKGTIFLQNSPFTSVFIVKSGTVKTFHVDERGVETILAFYLPGQMFGFDGIASGVHSCSAIALESTHICRPGVRVLNSTVIARPNIMQGILKEISRELNNAERRNRWLSQSTAEERVVDFLLDVAKRYRQC